MTSVAVDVVFADDLVRSIKLSCWHFSAMAQQQQRQKQSTPISYVPRPERRHNELTVVAASKISRPLLLSSAVVPPPPSPGRRPNEKLLADYTIRAICLSTRQQLAARTTADVGVAANWIEAKL